MTDQVQQQASLFEKLLSLTEDNIEKVVAGEKNVKLHFVQDLGVDNVKRVPKLACSEIGTLVLIHSFENLQKSNEFETVEGFKWTGKQNRGISSEIEHRYMQKNDKYKGESSVRSGTYSLEISGSITPVLYSLRRDAKKTLYFLDIKRNRKRKSRKVSSSSDPPVLKQRRNIPGTLETPRTPITNKNEVIACVCERRVEEADKCFTRDPHLLSATDQFGGSLLHLASEVGSNAEMIKCLVEIHRIDVNIRKPENNSSPLHYAAYHGDMQVMHIMVIC
jgi:hypothetical protein